MKLPEGTTVKCVFLVAILSVVMVFDLTHVALAFDPFKNPNFGTPNVRQTLKQELEYPGAKLEKVYYTPVGNTYRGDYSYPDGTSYTIIVDSEGRIIETIGLSYSKELTRAMVLLGKGLFAQAIDLLTKNTTTWVDKAASPLALRSLAYREIADAEKASKDAERAYSLDPNNDNAKEALGAVYMDKGNITEAEKVLSAVKGQAYIAGILLMTAYAQSGNYKKVMDSYNNLPEGYLSEGSVLRENNLKRFHVALKPYVDGKKRSAQTFATKGDYKQALKEYAEIVNLSDEIDEKDIMDRAAMIIKANPRVADLSEEARRYALRAEAATKEGKFEDAVKEYTKARKTDPFFPVLYKALALNYSELKQYRQAIKNLKFYVALYPDAPDVRNARDEIYRLEYLYDKAGQRN